MKNEPSFINRFLSWTLGILFGFIGLISVFSDPISGTIMLVMAAILLPPITKLIDEKWKFQISGRIKLVSVIIGIIIFGATMNTPKTTIPQKIGKKEDQHITSNEVTSGSEENTTNKGEESDLQPKTLSISPENKQDPPPTKIEDKPEQASFTKISETVSQKNALTKAKSYLNYTAFSHDGLVIQLEFEHFSHADAVYGADNSGANWNEQAAKKAKSYMDYSAFSRDSLIQQLKFEKFTQIQAEYGATAVGL